MLAPSPRSRIVHAVLLSLVVALAAPAAAQPEDRGHLELLIVLDGLRPDYVTEDLMPNLMSLAKRGVVFEDHHAVYPTVTRVNAASISTGAYPRTHGLLGNSVYFPEVERGKSLSTSSAENLMKIAEATGGELLTAPSLGEILETGGKKILVISSGSAGAALLLNPKFKGGGIIQTDFVRPAQLGARVREVLGPAPPDAYPALQRNARVLDAFFKIGLAEINPDVVIMWLTDPDHTAHRYGIGSPEANEALRSVDGEIGRLIEGLEQRRLLRETNIFITSDHGFSTHAGGGNLEQLLIDEGFKAGPGSDDVVIAGGAIHVKDAQRDTIRSMARVLQRTPWIGAVFVKQSRLTHPEGFVRGALSITSIYGNHERAGQLLVTPAWTDAVNEHGYAGATTQTGVAGHGTTSPYDIHNTLIAYGPDVKRKLKNPVPSGNVDLAPTLLYLNGIEPPETMDGRVLHEALKGGPKPKNVKVFRRVSRAVPAEIDGRRLELEISESSVDGTDYIDFTRTRRSASSP